MDKSAPRVTVWHHSAEPRDAKTMTLGTDLPIRTTHSCQILIFKKKIQIIIQILSFEQTHVIKQNYKRICVIYCHFYNRLNIKILSVH